MVKNMDNISKGLKGGSAHQQTTFNKTSIRESLVMNINQERKKKFMEAETVKSTHTTQHLVHNNPM